ncbi:hypothetical protein GCM10011409_18950 [Lentibacillus populi]|uniref:Uncharacterized protein n=1 Tax=Lentibacillus populi TaxID=1827502 RepID=A0A9W5TXJ6_9BACI|nr:hypothetical protein [Lentibacillus populi]GGB41639.1 hypothetical protein GCM10011409_18950 [Lentibacillus populi]
MEKANECSSNDLLLEHEAQMVSGILDSKERYRKIIKAGIAQWVKDFQNGKIKITTVDDLKKLIEVDLELQKDDL